MSKPRIAFIGAGRMASAMVKGLIAANVTLPDRIACTGARDGTAETLAISTGITATYDPMVLLSGCDWIILACKPQQLAQIPQAIVELSAGKSLLSILAGTPIARLRAVFPCMKAYVRAMPNTPGQIGMGITGYAIDGHADTTTQQLVAGILGALGDVIEVEESQLDAVTALSGSGPGYIFELIAALRDAGVAVGLPEPVSLRLALKTVQGAAALLEAVPASPEQHRDWVSSPGGTTLAGLAVMEQHRFREIIRETVGAAHHRSRELSA